MKSNNCVKSVANTFEGVTVLAGTLALTFCCYTSGSYYAPSQSSSICPDRKFFFSRQYLGLESPDIAYNGNTLAERCVDMEYQGENLVILDSFLDLKYNWDFNEAPPIPTDLISKIRCLICNLRVQPEIIPTPRESIQFEYITTNKDYLEIEFFSTGMVRSMYKPFNGTPSVKDIPFTIDEINKVVENFYANRL